MGQGLPRAAASVVVKRHGGARFRVGFAEMNGWRSSMEDAHVIFMRDSWGFFGVFDGHGGSQCSEFIASRMNEELEKCGPPENEAAMKHLALRLDLEFLDKKQPSGSTGTFAYVKPGAKEGAKYQLVVGNIGDSRVLLGRADGTIVEGSGTDGALTTDHKPDHPSEKERIERTGGKVVNVMGVARVNGDLSVSRSFGDAQYKETGGPAQEDHPVSAAPEVCELDCDSTDFLVLVCDGISEGEFPNREVVKLAAEELAQSAAEGGHADPGAAAAAVCNKALEAGSKDNLSCLIVLLGGGTCPGSDRELLPGPFDAPHHYGFRQAYESMAQHAGLSLAEAVEMRYDIVREQITAAERLQGFSRLQDCSRLQSLQSEIAVFGDGPPGTLQVRSAERVDWFKAWLEQSTPDLELDDDAKPDDQLIRCRMNQPTRVVLVAPAEELQPMVKAIPQLEWSAILGEKCGGAQGWVLTDDPSDGTSRVMFDNFVAWLPTNALTTIEDLAGDDDDDDDAKEDEEEVDDDAEKLEPSSQGRSSTPEQPLKRQRCS